MSDPNPPVPDLESDLRVMLRDRAATIDGPRPALPHVSSSNVSATSIVHLHASAHPRRNRWLAVAAAVIVILGAAAVAVATRTGPAGTDQLRTTAPPIEGAGLPAAFDLATAQPVFRLAHVRNPSVVARSYLAMRLSDNGADSAAVAHDLVLHPGPARGAIVPIRWHRKGQSADRGTVLVKVGARGSDVVASTTAGVDLSRIEVSGRIILGRVQTTEPAPAPDALVDVLPRGRALATFGDPPVPPTGPVGYGETAVGHANFRVDTKGEGAVVAVRFIDRRVEAISEVFLDAPDPNAPDLSTMTPKQMRHFVNPHQPDPRCVAADRANKDNLTNIFPNGGGTATAQPSDAGVFDLPRSSTPAEAVHALGTALGAPMRLATTTAMGGATTAGAANVGATPVELFITEGEGGWIARSVDTPAACRNVGTGNLTAPGAPNPKARVGITTIAGAVDGRAWYHLADGTTWTVALDADDFARGNIAVNAEWTDVKGIAVVGRDASGHVVVVQHEGL